MYKDNNKYNYYINKDLYIYKDPNLAGSNKDVYYYNNDIGINKYGNIVDTLMSTLTPYEVEKLRLLSLFAYNQGISNLSTSELTTLIQIVIDPKYDDMIRSLGGRLNNQGKVVPNPSSIPQTPPIQPIIQNNDIDKNGISKINSIKVKEPEKDEVKRANPIVEKFLSDIRNTKAGDSFRGWMLPNGELLSQYVDNTVSLRSRQDHSKLFKVFFNGLEKYDKQAYDTMKKLYDNYLSSHGVSYSDWDESFAVEVLGWMQIAHNGRKRILYRGERWQDRLLRPFLVDYSFGFEISDFGDCHYVEYMDLYNHIDEIISLGLEEKYGRLSA